MHITVSTSQKLQVTTIFAKIKIKINEDEIMEMNEKER